VIANESELIARCHEYNVSVLDLKKMIEDFLQEDVRAWYLTNMGRSPGEDASVLYDFLAVGVTKILGITKGRRSIDPQLAIAVIPLHSVGYYEILVTTGRVTGTIYHGLSQYTMGDLVINLTRISQFLKELAYLCGMFNK